MAIAIPLPNGATAWVDEADYHLVAPFRWHQRGRYVGRQGEAINGRRGVVWMHRQILGLPAGRAPEVDHVDRNGLNNTRANLRICTHQQNARNRSGWRQSVSQYKGVHWDQNRRGTRKNPWRARIKIDKGVALNLGRFENEVDAAIAYDRAARAHFGEFARPNFPTAETAAA